MFWDYASGLYDIYENWYNGKVNRSLSQKVASMVEKDDEVLECACGTGMLTKQMAPCCKRIIATDYSEGMLDQARKKCKAYNNVSFAYGNIMHLEAADNSFEKVVAGNVIHLVEEPKTALHELMRVCKPGGKVIVPTYVNYGSSLVVGLFLRFLALFGANFKRQFSYESYKQFFMDMGYNGVEFYLVEGKMPCAIAVISKQ